MHQLKIALHNYVRVFNGIFNRLHLEYTVVPSLSSMLLFVTTI